MPYQPVSTIFEDDYKELRIGDMLPFAGLNIRDMDTSIGDGQTPYAVNTNLDDGGKPTKRMGQTYFLNVAIESPINGLYKDLFHGFIVCHGGTKLYKIDKTTKSATVIRSGLANKRGFFYVFNGYLFYKNSVEYIRINDVFTVENAADIAYIPTITVGRAPTGGGTAYEKRNLIQPYVIDSFSGNGTATAYTVTFQGLDSSPIKASTDGGVNYDKLESTHFSVDRATGILTWNTAPATGTNNIKIKYAKTFGDAQMIIKAIRSTLFGGSTNDSRIFCCYNEDYKNVYWYTGLTGNTNSDAAYWPEFNFNRLGADDKFISAWTYLYSALIALKEDGIYKITYTNLNGAVVFPAAIMNHQVGCDMPDSVQIIKNFPVFFNTISGGWTIVSTLVESEKNLEPFSSLVNVAVNKSGIPGILDNTLEDLYSATSFIDGLKYYLNIGPNTYVWDYDKSPFTSGITTTAQSNLIWYYYTNINANHWAYINREIFYGHRTLGHLVKFQNSKNDFGLAINAVWRTKLKDLGDFTKIKTITKMWVKTRANQGATIEIKLLTDNGLDPINIKVPRNVTNSFDWDNFDWDNFTWNVFMFAPTIPYKTKHKNVNQMQLEFSNNVVDETLSILALCVQYMHTKEIK